MLGQLIKSFGGARRGKRLGDCLAKGLERQNSGDFDGAIAHYQAALELVPEHVDALCLAGNAYKLKGDTASAAAKLRLAAQYAPDRAHIFLLLASVVPLPEHRAEAIAALRRALALQPDTAELQVNYQLAKLLHDAGDAAEARLHYERAYELSGDDVMKLKRATVIPPVLRSHEHVQEIRDEIFAEVHRLLGQTLRVTTPETDIGHTDFYLAYHGLADRPSRELLARLYLHAYPSLDYVSPHVGEIAMRRDGKLRIGVVSKFLRNHTIGRLMRCFIERLDRNGFELTLFVWGEADDEISTAIRAAAAHTVVLGNSLSGNLERVAEQRMDLLFYCDIGMESMTYFMAFSRLAPVQCVTWGHPVTTGLPYMDYFLSSVLIEPEDAATNYSERLECLPESCAYVCYPRPGPPKSVDRSRYGVSPENHIYACPQTLFKLHPDFDAVLGGILRADPNGVALFIKNPIHLHAPLLDRWSKTLGDVLDRIRFLNPCIHEEFLELLAAADVLLDPPHFSGGNSSLEALGVGTPIVAWPGAYAKSRLTYASYKRMGVMDCVVPDAESYVQTAVRLGTDPVFRAAVKKRIAESSDVLFDDAATVRAMEAFFSEAITRARASGAVRSTATV
ncbi:MAG TPA: tetratricopeptide repeat protein [Burkholderiales bacterium]|nr:tetratricopeptide repeat protein [Burkholderiales bacterium]